MDREKQRRLVAGLENLKQGLDVNGNPIDIARIGYESQRAGFLVADAQSRRKALYQYGVEGDAN